MRVIRKSTRAKALTEAIKYLKKGRSVMVKKCKDGMWEAKIHASKQTRRRY